MVLMEVMINSTSVGPNLSTFIDIMICTVGSIMCRNTAICVTHISSTVYVTPIGVKFGMVPAQNDRCDLRNLDQAKVGPAGVESDLSCH